MKFKTEDVYKDFSNCLTLVSIQLSQNFMIIHTN